MLTMIRFGFIFLRSLVLGICILISQANDASAATLRALLIGDTLDRSIGPDLQLDIDNMREEVKRISEYTQMPADVVILTGHDVSPEAIWDAIDALEADDDDAILFYFSGHGYRTYGKGDDPWPYLYFSQQDEGIDYTEVIDALNDKAARLLVTLADCCNNRISDWAAPPVVSPKAGTIDLFAAHYTSLFVEAAGTVLITSSEAGQYSYSTPNGGLFTLAFLDAVQDAVTASDNPGWERMLERASAAVASRQRPDYRIDLES